jgi:hypothetical protein
VSSRVLESISRPSFWTNAVRAGGAYRSHSGTFCKVDAEFGAIVPGDLLTTSPTPGHAMKATDPLRAFGALFGKALQRLSSGRGLLPILVTLQ